MTKPVAEPALEGRMENHFRTSKRAKRIEGSAGLRPTLVRHPPVDESPRMETSTPTTGQPLDVAGSRDSASKVV
jgi:hypothetical protein